MTHARTRTSSFESSLRRRAEAVDAVFRDRLEINTLECCDDAKLTGVNTFGVLVNARVIFLLGYP